MRGLAALPAVAAPAPARARVRATPRPHAAKARGHSERLARRAQTGDREARRLLVDEHMPLIHSLARRYGGLGLPVEDLAQEGAIGLLKAVDDFDSSRGSSFSTYAFWRIRSEITHALIARGHVVRLPRPLHEHRRDVTQARRALAADGSEPEVPELAAATGLTTEAVQEALAVSLEVASLDEASADGTPRLDLASPDDVAAAAAAAEELTALGAAVERLPVRKREIIKRHFGLERRPQPLAEIASELELSPARTRALKDAALHELATQLEPVLTAA